jgi:asparagine synthase (glutamine-hydrolysing)
MTDQLAHRGPDDAGQWIDHEGRVALGHRRLSIVDLSEAGHQPMESPSGRFVAVLNGEIYNYREIKRELARPSLRFRGDSDTEVALAAFDRWGIAGAVSRLVGMFAFGIWDREVSALHLIRDRIGEKPLYFARFGADVLFGSELKSLRVHPHWTGTIDRASLASFLRFGYVPGTRSIFEGVSKVLPGAVVTFRAPAFELEQTKYWSAVNVAEEGMANKLGSDPQNVADILDETLRRSVRGQMIADVPLGAFLSGGVDSSLIVALMQAESSCPVRTFTIGFEDAIYNEAAYAREVAKHLGTDHTEFFVTGADARDVIPRLPTLYDEPFADSSQIPTHLVSALARQHVTVSLSGDGGDELFGGYGRYTETERLWSLIGRLPIAVKSTLGRGLSAIPPKLWDQFAASRLGRIGKLKLVNPTADRMGRVCDILAAPDMNGFYEAILSQWRDPEEVMGAIPRNGSQPSLALDGLDPISELMLRDLVGYLPDDILVKVDRASMGVGLETRAPFLDHRVVELAWRIPLAMKIRGGEGKWILRQLLDRYVPRRLIERPKMGFGVPLAAWLRGPLREWADDLLDPTRLSAEGFFSPTVVEAKWREHTSGQRNWQNVLWDLLMFQVWLADQSGNRLRSTSHSNPMVCHPVKLLQCIKIDEKAQTCDECS